MITVEPNADGYPAQLLRLDQPPRLTVSRPLQRAARIVAIVGSRQADEAAMNFAYQLAFHFARAGFLVASGGAQGIDWAAHRGAVRGGGATWCVACTGAGADPYPPEHERFFRAIARTRESRMIWPFADDQHITKHTPRFRNGVLIALASVVIVIQARIQSGSLNAATWAERLGRPLFVAPGAPWDTRFTGSTSLILGGATPLWSIEHTFAALAIPPPDLGHPKAVWRGSASQPVPVRPNKRRKSNRPKVRQLALESNDFSIDEKLVFSHISNGPTQQDEIIARSGLGASSTLTALLTLSLKDVVVEGPDGFFRRTPAL